MLTAEAIEPNGYAVIITTIATVGAAVITAMFKFPRVRHVNSNGEALARSVELVEIRGRLTVLEKAVAAESEYTHKSMHEIRNQLHSMQLSQALSNQKLDDICDSLKVRRRTSDSCDQDE